MQYLVMKRMRAMRNIILSLVWLCLVILVSGCATEEPFGRYSYAFSEGPSSDVLEPKEGRSEVYIFNTSRWTLTRRVLAVTDGSKFLITLPRRTYKKLYLDYGSHDLRFWGGGGNSDVLALDVSEGRKYFVVIDYDPSRGGWPLAFLDQILYGSTSPTLIREISDDKAQRLLKKFKSP
jgi:hypothetical protein